MQFGETSQKKTAKKNKQLEHNFTIYEIYFIKISDEGF